MSAPPSGRARELRPADGVTISPDDWETRAGQVRQGLAADGVEDTSLADALGEFRFVDEEGRTWSYDGAVWMVWEDARPSVGTPPASLRLQPFTMDFVPDADENPPAGVDPLDDTPEPLPTAEEISATQAETPALSGLDALAAPPQAPVLNALPSAPAYRPTHLVPAGGLPAWSRPDAAIAPDHRLDPGLDVMVAESYPNGWARIVCSNTWSGWVDGRLLSPLGGVVTAAPAAASPGATAPLDAPGAVPTARKPLSDVRAEVGLAALVGVLVWVAAVFVAPIGLRFAVLANPVVVGTLIAIGVLALKVVSGARSPTARDFGMLVVDAVVASVVLYLFSPA